MRESPSRIQHNDSQFLRGRDSEVERAGARGKEGQMFRKEKGGVPRGDGKMRDVEGGSFREHDPTWQSLLPGRPGALAIDNTKCTLACVFAECA